MTSISSTSVPMPPPPAPVRIASEQQGQGAADSTQQAVVPEQDAASVSVTPEARQLAAEQARQDTPAQPEPSQTTQGNQATAAALRQQLVG
jgi:hypothetical protein